MKKAICYGICGIIFCLLGRPALAQSKSATDIKELKQKIVITNLINGLELTSSQKRTLIEQIHKAGLLEMQFERTLQQQYAHRGQIYHNILREVQQGQLTISPRLRQRFRRFQREMEKVESAYDSKTKQLVDQVKHTLRPEQIYILETYKPCIIPHLSNGRIGQADHLGRWTRKLDRIYYMNTGQYLRMKDQLIKTLMKKIQYRSAKNYDFEASKQYNALEEIMDRMRNLSEVDYAVQKSVILDELQRLMSRKQKNERNVGAAIKRFILQPYTAQLLSQKVIGGHK